MPTYFLKYLLNWLLLFTICVFSYSCAKPVANHSQINEDPITVTSVVEEYANLIVKPSVQNINRKDKLSLLRKISETIISKEHGVNSNAIEPSKFIYYDIFDTLKLGFLVTLNLSSQQKQNIRSWHAKYMSDKAADVFFAPSASEIIKYRAAFGCTHYARVFMAVIKSLKIIENPDNLRYVVACVANDYNNAYNNQDYKMTINGHQFVMARVDNGWYAINTSKAEIVEMGNEFSPDKISAPNNTAIQFPSYPKVTFLFRKIGKTYNENIQDTSHHKLMNIYRSGESNSQSFSWNKFK